MPRLAFNMSRASKLCLIAGVGPGTGKSIAKAFAAKGYEVALLARSQATLQAVADEIKSEGGSVDSCHDICRYCQLISLQAFPVVCDISSPKSIHEAFGQIKQHSASPIKVAIFNCNSPFLVKGFLDLTEQDVETGHKIMGLGAFHFSQNAIKEILQSGGGSLIYTGASASLRGSSLFAAVAMPKFELRALSQSLAREFGPRGIHVSHCIVDGESLHVTSLAPLNGVSSGLINTEKVGKMAGEGEAGKVRQLTFDRDRP